MQGRFTSRLPLFDLICPALRNKAHTKSAVTLVSVEIGSKSGWLSDEVRAEHSHRVRDLLQGCLRADLDVLLPRMGSAGAAELFFIVAISDHTGSEAIIRRIREQFAAFEDMEQADLTIRTSYRLLDAIKRTASESIEEFSEKVATGVRELINEEVSSRTVENG
jgi:hypothetical protein